MTSTRNGLRASLLCRTTGLLALELLGEGGGRPIVYAVAVEGADPEEVAGRIRDVLFHVAPAGLTPQVIMTKTLPSASASSVPSLQGAHYLASLSSDSTTEGMLKTMNRLVPSLGRLIIDCPQPGVLDIKAEDYNGAASEAFLSEIRAAFSAIAAAGIKWTVGAIQKQDTRNDLVKLGRLSPRRTSRLVLLSQEDESQFVDRIRQLTNGSQVPSLPAIDDATGTQVLYIPGAAETNSGLGSFLPIYDRVFVLMLPEKKGEGAGDGFRQRYGVSPERFLDFVRSGRVVPAFKNDLGCYDEHLIRPIVDDLSLQYLSVRELDYLAARYIWQSSPFQIPLLRNSKETTRTLHEVVRSICGSPERDDPRLSALQEILQDALASAEAFEGIVWGSGYMCLGTLGPGAAITHMLRSASKHSKFLDTATRDTVAIEAYLASTSIALAQSMNASLSQSLLLNNSITGLVASAFRTEVPSVDPLAPKDLDRIVSSLDLCYSNEIPPDEYLDLFDQAETRRIRALAASLLGDIRQDADSEAELRQRVICLNSEVSKIAKRSLESANVDILGDIAKVATPSAGAAFIAAAFELLGVPTVKHALSMVADRAVEDTRIGSALDKIRGGLNGVSSHAIRLYRVRRKLSSIKRQQS